MKKTACLISLLLAVFLVFPVLVRADVIWEPPVPEETETEAPETVAEKEEPETEPRTDKTDYSDGSSEASSLSAPIITVSAAVLVIAAALLVHNIVRSKKGENK